MGRVEPRGGGGGGDGRPRTLLRPGPYLLALVWFQRKTGRDSGKEYLSVRYEVAGGASKGSSFFDMLGLDLSKPGTATRWQIFSDACGVTEAFELGEMDEGTDEEGDDNIRRLFVGVPFAAEVIKETQGQYTNNRIGQFIFPRNWREQWQEWAHEYIEARNARSRRAPERDLEDPAPNSPEDVGYPPASGESDDRPPSPAAAFDDDDIPF